MKRKYRISGAIKQHRGHWKRMVLADAVARGYSTWVMTHRTVLVWRKQRRKSILVCRIEEDGIVNMIDQNGEPVT